MASVLDLLGTAWPSTAKIRITCCHTLEIYAIVWHFELVRFGSDGKRSKEIERN